MKTTKFGFLFPDDEEEFIKTFNEMYNNNELEEIIDLLPHIIANSNIEPTKSNVLDYLKQNKELYPVLSLSHTAELLHDLPNKI